MRSGFGDVKKKAYFCASNQQNMQKSLLFIVMCVLGCCYSCGDPKTEYTELLQDIDVRNSELLQSYRNADNESQQKIVVNKTRQYLTELLSSKLSTYWYGTPLAADGRTELPRESSTSPVNFVVTVLRDANFNIDRNALLQQTPNDVIRALTAEANIKRFENEEAATFIDRLHEWGNGIYLLALDDTFGFLVVNACGVRFIYPSKNGVKNEDASLSIPVRESRVRVLGDFIETEWSVRKWLAGDAFGGKAPATNDTTPSAKEL